MAIYKFEKIYEKAYYAEVEADTFEDACLEVENADWDEDDGGESYLTNSYAQEIDENGDVLDELDWSPC